MKITYENEILEIPEGTKIREGLKEKMEASNIKDIIAARYNNTIESLDFPINRDGEIEFINRQDKDGRIIYNICKEDGGYEYFWYDLSTGETQQFQRGIDLMIFSLSEETADYFIGYYKGSNLYISKQDWYNENYDAVF